MVKSEFDSLVKELKVQIKNNKNMLDKAISEELSKGNSINLNKIEKIISEYENIESLKDENQKIAVCYSGNPQITITYILDSIVNNNNVTLCMSDYKVFNRIFIELVEESIINCKLQNKWINFNSNYNEVYLRDNKNIFNKFEYIGDYYEYERFKSFIKKDVEYNNFGSIKLYIDKNQYKDEFKKILNYASKENYYIDVYDDVDDFINESKDQDYSVVYGDTEILNTIRKSLKGEMLFNAFPYESYKFEIKR